MSEPIKFAFFGTDEFAVSVLDTLVLKGMLPALIVTTPDKPKGRHLVLTAPPAKLWAEKRNIPVLQPIKLKDAAFSSELTAHDFDLFIVASYGKIIPASIFELPKFKTLNVHPSLLPALRGPSPVSTAILEDQKTTGVTIMLIDEAMDHGPILAQKEITLTEWPSCAELEYKLATLGGKLLAETIPKWVSGLLEVKPQDESRATYTKLIEKEDAEINLTDDPYENFRKIQAYSSWPRAYTFFENAERKIRVQITSARFEEGELLIDSVIPEGKKEMPYEDFLRGMRN